MDRKYFLVITLLTSMLLCGCETGVMPPENHNTSGNDIEQPQSRSASVLPLTERDFYIGMVPTPKSVPDTTFDDITAAYQEAGQLGEVTMVWGSPGGIGLYDKLKQNQVVTAVRVYGLKPVLTLNFHTIKQVSGKGLEVMIDAPEGVTAQVSDPEFRQMWVDEARDIAREFQPEYFSLGNEINDYFYLYPDDLEGYLTLFDEAYEAIKSVSPDTRVMVVFSYNHLIDNGQWQLLERFKGADVLGMTTYPWKHFDTPEGIADDYYSRLRSYIDMPVAFTEIGWAGDETAQADFLVRFLELIKDLDVEMVNWLFLHEMKITGIGESVFSPEAATIALKNADGTKKEVYDVWLELKEVPIK